MMPMDEKEQMIFKGKFVLCVALLNIIIFSAAVVICVWTIVDDSHWFKMPVIIAAIVAFATAILLFVLRYQATKAWLNVHGITEKERIARVMKEDDEHRAGIRAELEAEMREELSLKREV
jgi:predicted membrane protein